MAEKALKLSSFAWEGLDRRGSKVKGEVKSNTLATAKAELRRQGINPKKVRKKSALFESGKGKQITPKDIAIFSRQLATMMSAGVPLVQSFDIIGRSHEKPRMRDMLLAIKADIEAGNTLADALAKYPFFFDDLFVNLVRAGEHAGVLESLLHKIATYKERTEEIKSKIKKALFYPTAVIVVAFIVTAILLIYVVPQFEDLFKGFGAALPAFTQMVINLSRFMQDYWWAVFGIVIGAVVAAVQAKKRSRKFQGIPGQSDAEDARYRRHHQQSGHCPLRSHPFHHVRRRCSAGGSHDLGCRRYRQPGLLRSGHTHARRRLHRPPAAGGDA